MSSNQHASLDYQFTILLEEYKALKTEIVSNLNAARQLTTVTVGLTGILLGVIPFTIPYLSQPTYLPYILFIPFVFYLLAWTSLRYTLLAVDMGEYIRNNIAPKLRSYTPVPLSKGNDILEVFTWDNKGRNTIIKHKFLFLPIAGSHYALTLLSALIPVFIFIKTYFDNYIYLSTFDLLLLTANATAFLYSMYWGLRVELSR